MRIIPILSVVLLCPFSNMAQTVQQKIKQYCKANEIALINEYRNFISIPNVSSDTVNIRKNADYILQSMRQMGIKAELLQGKTNGVTPAVYGSVIVPVAKRTIAFYAHYDGQPVNPAQWTGGLQPFKPVFITAPVERGGTITDYKAGDPVDPSWRLSGRGSADDKAGVMTILNAYNALIKTKTVLNNNIIFLFEGEEEVGSTHLDEIFSLHKDKLKSDVWIIADGPRHVSGKKLVQFGVRGDVNMHLTVYGAKRPLHSGNYGNWAPNPARMLVELLAGMKDEKGHVTVKGYYDDVIPLSASEKEAIANIPNIEEILKKELGIAEPEGDGKSFLELLHQPTLNINGIQSANVGAMASNIIPPKAEAVLDLRLVSGNEVEKQIQRVKDHIASKGYHIIDREPTDEERLKYGKIIKITSGKGYNAQRTPMDLPVAREIVNAIQATVDYPIVLLPSAGGSLPLYLFEKMLNAKVITIPVVNYDNNQHAENENVQISYLWEGIETMAMIMMMK